jgi:hypothetical protein
MLTEIIAECFPFFAVFKIFNGIIEEKYLKIHTTHFSAWALIFLDLFRKGEEQKV